MLCMPHPFHQGLFHLFCDILPHKFKKLIVLFADMAPESNKSRADYLIVYGSIPEGLTEGVYKRYNLTVVLVYTGNKTFPERHQPPQSREQDLLLFDSGMQM